MDILSTKTRFEVEDEEAVRLVRPAPKLKPPRRDRRREHMQVDEDPDVQGDPDVAKDKDRSMNYKDIGGSLTQRVVRRVLADQERVPAKSKETGETVMVSPETLKEQPHKYEKIKKDEERGKEELSPAQLQKYGDQLRELTKGNAALKSKLQSMITPGQEMHGFAQQNPDFPISQVFKGVQFPEGLDTLGNLQKAFSTKPQKAKGKAKPKKEPKPKAPEKAPEEGEEAAQKPEGTEESEAPESAPAEEASEGPDYSKVQEWIASGQHKDPGFQRFLEAIPTSESENGQVMVLNSDTKKRVPFEELPPEKQTLLMESFEKEGEEKKKSEKGKRQREKLLKDGAEASRLLLDVKNGPAWTLLEQLRDPTSDASQKLTKLAEGHDLDFVRPEKVFPELKGALPEKLSGNLGALKKALDTKRSYDTLAEYEKAGIPEPKRPEPTESEQREVLADIVDTFPPDLAADIIAKNLHPQDARELVRSYVSAQRQKPKNIKDLVEKTKQFYSTDPANVKPPRIVTVGGKPRVFSSLPPNEQAEAMRRHQMQVVAASLAAKERLSYELSLPSVTNQPRVPPQLASNLADFMLRGGSEKEAKKQAEKTFEETLDSGEYTPIKEATAKKLLSQLDPGAQRIARGFLEANDYQEAREKFLSRTPFQSEESDSFSEMNDAQDIAKGMRKATEFFRKKANLYGTSRHPGAVAFKVRTLARLRALAPKKVPIVRKALDKLDADDYDRQMEAYNEWLKRKAKAEKVQKKWDKEYQTPGKKKPEPFSEPEPPKPEKPVRYDEVRGNKEETTDLFEDLANRSKVASVLERYQNSTYPSGIEMKHQRTAVYHGVDPEESRPTAYPPWSQAQQGRLGETDYNAILASAEEWLKTPVLSDNVKDVLRDTQLRAALDIAIHTSKYNRSVDPNTYNILLARLGGEPAPESGEAFGTLPGKVTPMKASRQVRKMASELAKEAPKAAFELMSLAVKLAAWEDKEAAKWIQKAIKDKGALHRHFGIPEDETIPTEKIKSELAKLKKKEDKSEADKKLQHELNMALTLRGPKVPPPHGKGKKEASDNKYAELRSLIIRTAAADAEAKRALLPILQTLKV